MDMSSKEYLAQAPGNGKLNGVDNPALELNQAKYPANATDISNVYNVEQGRTMDKEYEPYDHRQVSHPTTYSETLIHMLKASLGTGILAMPSAFSHAGYAVATVATVVIGAICTYTIHILIQSEYELCKRNKKPCMTYPETAYAACREGPAFAKKIAPAVPFICNIFLLMYQLGSCCIYVVFIAANLQAVGSAYWAEYPTWAYATAILIPLILVNWVRNLKYLAPLSTLANAVTIVSFAIIFWYMFNEVPSVSQRRAVASMDTMPLFFGTVLFAMEAIGVVMPLENEMKEPKRFGSTFGVLNCAMIPITLLYTFVGFFGYIKYGECVHGSVTLDIGNEVPAQVAKVLLSFAIFVTHGLACYVAFDISWREWVKPKTSKHPLIAEYILRTCLVLITYVLAVAIPELDLFISLVGAVCLSTMGLSFPALVQLFTYWKDVTGIRFTLMFLKNMTIVAFAALGFVIGTWTSVEGIYNKLVLGKDETSGACPTH